MSLSVRPFRKVPVVLPVPPEAASPVDIRVVCGRWRPAAGWSCNLRPSAGGLQWGGGALQFPPFPREDVFFKHACI